MDNKTFITKLSEETGFNKKELSHCLNSFFELFEDTLTSGDTIAIPAFGSFETKKRNERIMSHPSDSSKRILIPPKVVVNFKPSVIMKGKLNGEEDGE